MEINITETNSKKTTQSNEICQAIINDAVNFAVHSTDFHKYGPCKNIAENIKNFTPLIVSANTPINLMQKTHFSITQPTADLNKAISEKLYQNNNISKTSIENNIYETSAHRDVIQLLNNITIQSTDENIVKKFSISPVQNDNLNHIKNKSINDLNIIKKTKQKYFIEASEEISGVKMSKLENTDTLHSEKLEIEIKKLIEEINDIDNKKTENFLENDGQGDVDIKKSRHNDPPRLDLLSNTDKLDNINNQLNATIDNETLETHFIDINSEAVVTKKFCRTDLLNNDNKLLLARNDAMEGDYTDAQVAQDRWEEMHEKELQVIEPEYSDTELDDLQTYEAYGGQFFDIDLCCVTTNVSALTSSDDETKPMVGKAEKPVLEMDTTEEKSLLDEQKAKTLEYKCSNASSNIDKKSKKKKISLGNRILNFFTNKNKQTSDLHLAN